MLDGSHVFIWGSSAVVWAAPRGSWTCSSRATFPGLLLSSSTARGSRWVYKKAPCYWPASPHQQHARASRCLGLQRCVIQEQGCSEVLVPVVGSVVPTAGHQQPLGGWAARRALLCADPRCRLCPCERFSIRRTVWGCSLRNLMRRGGEVTSVLLWHVQGRGAGGCVPPQSSKPE